MPAPAIGDEVRARIARAFVTTTSITAAAKLAGVNFHTAKKYAPLNLPGSDDVSTDSAEATDLEIHDVCNLFPEMTGDELTDLSDDIRENGLREPIWRHDGKVIDGRNRLKACGMAGVEPEFREWDGNGSLLAFVLSLNLIRRHLDETQRAMVAARAKPIFEAEAKRRQATSTGGADPQLVSNLTQAGNSKARDQAADLLRVSSGSVEAATQVLKKGAPELVKAVEKGEVKVSAAAEVATLSKREQAEVVAKGPAAVREKAKEIRGKRKPSIPLTFGNRGTDPAKPGDPADVAEGRRNGTIPADGEVEVTEPEGEPEPALPPPQMTDDEYLQSLTAREYLADHVRKRFDVEALLYRALSPIRRKFAAACKPLTNVAKKECQGHIGPYMGKHFYYLRANDPTRWKACADCSGSAIIPLIGQCPACHGEGYMC